MISVRIRTLVSSLFCASIIASHAALLYSTAAPAVAQGIFGPPPKTMEERSKLCKKLHDDIADAEAQLSKNDAALASAEAHGTTMSAKDLKELRHKVAELEFILGLLYAHEEELCKVTFVALPPPTPIPSAKASPLKLKLGIDYRYNKACGELQGDDRRFRIKVQQLFSVAPGRQWSQSPPWQQFKGDVVQIGASIQVLCPQSNPNARTPNQ